MRKWLLTAWCMLPVGATAYHYGPGQDRVALDMAGELVAEAREHAARGRALTEEANELAASSEFAQAENAFSEALALLPAKKVEESWALRVERAKCQLLCSKLPDANADMTSLIEELAHGQDVDPELMREARRTYANSQYYMTWLMRLEGVGRDEWEPRIESARQTYKLLAEESQGASAGDELERDREDLEAAIRLARMDLTELQGLPLPSQ